MEQRKTSSFAFSKQILQLLFNQQAYAKDKVLWIGDSHAAFMRKGLKEKSIDGFRICSLVYWLGPRLMYSVSKSGFPSTLLFRSFVRFWKPRVIIVLLGEIDIRMFLHEPRLRDSSWVRDYLVKVDDIRKVLHSSQIFVLTSMPVSDLPPLDAIERKGTLVERLSGFSWMQESPLASN